MSAPEPTTRASLLAYRRTRSFLTLMERMDAPGRTAFLKIYEWAPKPHSLTNGRVHPEPFYKTAGKHVRFAMMEALTNPEVAYWVRMNLALRVGRKFAQTTGRLQKAAAIEDVLESFHVAADAYVLAISLEDASARRAAIRKEKQQHSTATAPVLSTTAVEDYSPLPENELAQELVAIGEFKRRIIPGLVKSIRKSAS